MAPCTSAASQSWRRLMVAEGRVHFFGEHTVCVRQRSLGMLLICEVWLVSRDSWCPLHSEASHLFSLLD